MVAQEEEPTPENELEITTLSNPALPLKKNSEKGASLDSEKSMALSVHEIGYEKVAEHVTPLKICDSNLRRSLRYTGNMYRSDFSREAESILASGSRTSKAHLRRGQLLIKGGKDLILKEKGEGISVGSRKRRRSEEDNSAALHGSENESISRKSPRLGSPGKSMNGALIPLPEPVSSKKNTSGRRGSRKTCSRKSPRLNPNLMTEFIALPTPGFGRSDSGKCFTRVKQLRNRNVEMHVEIENKNRMRSDSVGKGSRRGKYQNNAIQMESKLADASRESPSTASGFRIVGEKDSYLQEFSLKSDFAESSSGVNYMTNVSAEGSISMTTESQLPEIDLADALAKIELDKRDSDDGDKGATPNSPEKIKFETPGALGKCHLGDINVDADAGDMNLNDSCSTPEKMESEKLPATAAEKFVNLNDSCSTPEKMESEKLPATPAEKCDSNVFSERSLRSRKIEFQKTGGRSVEKNSRMIKEDITKNKEKMVKSESSNKKHSKQNPVAFYIGLPIPEEEAQERWGWRYELKRRQPKNKGWILNAGEEDEIILNVDSHYAQAKVAGCVFNIGDCVYIKGEGRKKHIGRILEFFKTIDGEDYFRVQWFFRAEDTVMKEEAGFHDKKRIFYSTLMNDNLIDCIISKVNIVEVPSAVGLEADTIPPADFYYDMEYSVEYSTFRNLQSSNSFRTNDSFHAPITASPLEGFTGSGPLKGALTLLDLFAGCGGMSTGLCLGARLSGINLVTRWAVDFEKSACDSIKLNHPETQVRNESAEDYLELLKAWEKLCQCYVFSDLKKSVGNGSQRISNGRSKLEDKDPDEEFEVSHLIDICYGDPNETGKNGVHFKVRWKGYDLEDDTWEPMEGLSNCRERIEEFVRNGLRSKILPLPGEVDVICGGPPCQGISGYNRHRNVEEPLTDEKNQQIVVFMNIVEFLKPKYVLMENVVDILRLDSGSLGRYALSRLVHMRYQTRLGTVAAGCYGLPQFRLRVFMWGALPSEKLPPFPLPTHEVVVRYWPPLEFERNTVAYDEGQPRKLEEALFLRDAISDLPPVTNDETRDEMEYSLPPESGFQEYIRLSREEMMGSTTNQITKSKKQLLYDHRPFRLNEDNYLRVCQIPHRKGANFRDLPGLIVGGDNVVRRDTTKPYVLPSGEPIVPDSSVNLDSGKSKRPFGRLWWDETMPTVLTFPHFKNQAILHPEQDRVLTVRECARLQGFPDFYRFCGTVKERYCQVGNAVAIPVGRALGFALGMAFQKKLTIDEPLMTLPPDFASLRPLKDEIVVLGNQQ